MSLIAEKTGIAGKVGFSCVLYDRSGKAMHTNLRN